VIELSAFSNDENLSFCIDEHDVADNVILANKHCRTGMPLTQESIIIIIINYFQFEFGDEQNLV
jgi:hypothetical protein